MDFIFRGMPVSPFVARSACAAPEIRLLGAVAVGTAAAKTVSAADATHKRGKNAMNKSVMHAPISHLLGSVRSDYGSFGEFDYIISNSPDLKTAIESVRLFEVMGRRVSLSILSDGTEVVIRFQGCESSDFAAILLIRLMYLVARASEVQFEPIRFVARCSPSSFVQLGVDDLLRVPIHYRGAFDGAVIRASDLETRFHRADVNLFRLLSSKRETQPEVRRSWKAEVEKLVFADICDFRAPTVGETARKLDISARTLQHHLNEEGVTYSSILSEQRKRIALSLLSDPELSLEELSNRLGFSECTSFHRAFRKWTGQTPMKFRNANGSETNQAMVENE